MATHIQRRGNPGGLKIFVAMVRERRKSINLEWNVWYYDQNIDKIRPFNIFGHKGFNNDISYIFTQSPRIFNITPFKKEIDKIAMYYFWCKAEYEVNLCDWFKGDAKAKIDIYTQLKLNWDRFIDYLWNEYINKID